MKATNFIKENKSISIYATFLLLTFVFLWLIKFFNISYPLTITTQQTSGELVVVGEGKVDITPNLATVDLGIVANNVRTVEEVQSQINKTNNAIVDEMKKIGIDKKDIKTSNYSISPNYNYTTGGNGQISGYNGNATVTVKVHDTSKLPQVLTSSTKAGANQIIGTNYSIENPENYREEARSKAIANAKEQAQKIANSLGVHLGKAVNIVESTGNQGPIPMAYGKSEALMMGGGAAPDLQPGTQTITSTVTVYFEKR